MSTSGLTIRLPEKIGALFTPARGELAYRCAYGGRGSAKSYSLALMASLWGLREPMRILCVREFQDSIKESFHAELRAAIASVPWFGQEYDVGVDYLRAKNGTEFIFRGLRHNASSLKSLAKIDLTIVEEAEDVPEHSWIELLPTVFRTPRSECWVIWNPKKDGSPTDKRYRKTPPQRCMSACVSYRDNPWFPPELEEQRLHACKTLDASTYAWVWEGEYLKISKAQVFVDKYAVDEFTPQPHWSGPYQGLDWGFAQDPTAAVRCWVNGGTLYIEREASKIGLELDDTSDYLRGCIEGFADYTTRADNARPESISHVKRKGLPKIEAVEKWKGSVEDGIAHMRSYSKIVIHPRCRETIREFGAYSYKTDRLSGDVMPDVVDAFNHLIDATRYALAPLIRKHPAGLAFG